jgi:hypothetical protein
MKSSKLLFFFLLASRLMLHAQVPNYLSTNGLVGWWPFNGNANDESGNGNNGTVNGPTLTTDRFGIANKAYSFNPSLYQYINIGQNQSINNLNEVTISAWLNPNSNASYSHVLNKSNDVNNHQFVLSTNNNGIYFYYGNGSAFFQTNTSPILNQWNHILITYSYGFGTNNCNIYLNGLAIGTFTTTVSLQSTTFNLKFGSFGNSNLNTVKGKLDDIAIWNRILTQQEITALYTSTPLSTIAVNPTSTSICAGSSTTLTATTNGATPCHSSQLPSNLQSGLVGYWPFCDNANDASNNGNNGTVNGAILTTDRFGNANSAYDFDGINDYILYSAANLPTSTRTVSLWFYSNNIGVGNAGRSVLGYGGQTCGQSWNMHLDNAGSPQGQNSYEVNSHCNVYSITSSYGANIPNGNWHHWVAMTSSVGTQFYLDGALILTSPSFLNNTYVQGKDFLIGAYTNPNGIGASLLDPNNTPWNGKLDDIAIWNRVLTSSEIQQLYISGTATFSWSPGGATTSSISVTPSTTTTYTCTATINGQSVSATATVNVNSIPTATITANGPLALCPSQNVTLCGPAIPNMSYLWCDGSVTPCITANTAGIYCLTVLDSNGCSSDTSYVVITELLGSSSNQVVSACDSYTMNGQTFNQSGIYNQIIPNSVGCDSTITLDLTINLGPATPNVYVENQTTLSTDNIPGLSYQWFFCSDLIDVLGATDAIFTPTMNAFYAVIVSNSCGSDTSDCIDVNSIGLNEFNELSIELYPNPNNGHFSISVPSSLIGNNIEIRDINGKLLRSFFVNEEWQEINLSDLARGNYWLNIEKSKPIQIIKN